MTDILNKANEHYDQDHFIEARELYRKAFLSEEPTSHHLALLSISEDYEKLLYIKQLRILYPDSSTIMLEEATYLAQIGMARHSLKLWSKLLSADNLSTEKKQSLHYIRFRYNYRFAKPDFEILYEDFRYIYELGTQHQNMLFARILTELNSEKAFPFLKKIQSEFTDEADELYQLLELKMDYIKKLNAQLFIP